VSKINYIQTQDRVINQIQQNVKNVVDPLSANPVLNGLILTNQVLVSGDNTINHTLGRTLQGWTIVRQRSAASLYDKQDSNPTPALTLVLNASAGVSVDLYVF